MTEWVGHRRRGRRKGERKVKVLDNDDLLPMFDCADVDRLLEKQSLE